MNVKKCVAQIAKNQPKEDKEIPGPVEWAEQNRILTEASGAPKPGPWTIEQTPYLKEILECLHPSSKVQRITLCKSSQIGYTVSILENAILWVIDANPGPSMYVTATNETLSKRMKLNIEPAIDAAQLRHKLRAPKSVDKSNKSRATGDITNIKQFAGGFIITGSIQSKTHALSQTIKTLLLDEVDADIDVVGSNPDIIRLYEMRTKPFQRRGRKIFIGSTPRLKQTSHVWPEYERGDQRKYYVPCKKCGKMQPLIFDNLKFKDKDGGWNPKGAYYQCPHCGSKWVEEDKADFLSKGEWRPTHKNRDPQQRSYHLNALYAPTLLDTWANVASMYIDAYHASKKQGNVTLMQLFINDALGMPWEVRGNAPNGELIELRSRNSYSRGTYPEPVIFCTLGVDCHADRIEAELLGWSPRSISYSIDYYILEAEEGESVHSQLHRMLTPIIASERPAPIALTFIDSGFSRDDVIRYCQECEYMARPIIGRAATEKWRSAIKIDILEESQTERYQINVDYLKDMIYSNLTKDSTLPYPNQKDWTLNHPKNYDIEYYRQLTSERKEVQVQATGNRVIRYIKDYIRNEALDCKVYATAAFLQFLRTVCTDDLQLDAVSETAFWDLNEGMEKRTGRKKEGALAKRLTPLQLLLVSAASLAHIKWRKPRHYTIVPHTHIYHNPPLKLKNPLTQKAPIGRVII